MGLKLGTKLLPAESGGRAVVGFLEKSPKAEAYVIFTYFKTLNLFSNKFPFARLILYTVSKKKRCH